MYYNLTFPFGPALTDAQILADGPWTTPNRFQRLLTYLSTLDFTSYDTRRQALSALVSTRFLIPRVFLTYPFDPLSYPILPPLLQTRFPALGVYLSLSPPEYSTLFAKLSQALSYRDGDSPYQDALTLYQASTQALAIEFAQQRGFYTRESLEFTLLLLWAPYPPPVPVWPTHHPSRISPSTSPH